MSQLTAFTAGLLVVLCFGPIHNCQAAPVDNATQVEGSTAMEDVESSTQVEGSTAMEDVESSQGEGSVREFDWNSVMDAALKDIRSEVEHDANREEKLCVFLYNVTQRKECKPKIAGEKYKFGEWWRCAKRAAVLHLMQDLGCNANARNSTTTTTETEAAEAQQSASAEASGDTMAAEEPPQQTEAEPATVTSPPQTAADPATVTQTAADPASAEASRDTMAAEEPPEQTIDGSGDAGETSDAQSDAVFA